jgi:hypothetical protein
MPGKSRIDAPGALHPVIGEGIEWSKILQDDAYRGIFLSRLAEFLTDNQTACPSSMLLPNH